MVSLPDPIASQTLAVSAVSEWATALNKTCSDVSGIAIVPMRNSFGFVPGANLNTYFCSNIAKSNFISCVAKNRPGLD